MEREEEFSIENRGKNELADENLAAVTGGDNDILYTDLCGHYVFQQRCINCMWYYEDPAQNIYICYGTTPNTTLK